MENDISTIKIALVHAIIQLDCISKGVPVTKGMRDLLERECNDALDVCREMEHALNNASAGVLRGSGKAQ